MMKIAIEINNNSVTQTRNSKYSDDYVEQNWKEFAYNASANAEQDDDVTLKEEYGKYLNEKYSI